MRMLVLGAGLQGSACAYDLLRNPDIERVVLADRTAGRLPAYLEPFRLDPRLERVELDARDADAVRAAMRGAAACMNALPYYFNLDIARLAVASGVHCCDLGGNTDIVFRQLELDGAARAAGVSVVPDCGLAPGMVNILAAAGIADLDTTDAVRIRVGGLPQHPRPPLGYQIVYSIEGVLDYYTTRSWVVREGRREQVEALTGIEPVAFPQPVGTLEAFHTAGGLSTMAWTFEGRIRNMDYKTLRYPGHAETMRAIRELGLLDETPVRLADGSEVVPRQVFIACAEPRLRRPDARDLVALRVEAEGTRNGEPLTITYQLIDFYDEATGISAMERATGFSLSITGQLQAAGAVAGPGVRTPDQAVPADAYIAALAERGVNIERTTEARAGV
jgi:lysine 6-dehydrogenase